MSGLPHLYPRADNAAELIRAERWDNITLTIDGWREASTPADRAYYRGAALFAIREWKRWECKR